MKIDACNSDLVVAIIEVVAGNMIPTENHLISPDIYLDLNPMTLENNRKRIGPSSFLSLVELLEKKKERGPRRDGGGGSDGARSWQSYPRP